MRKPALLLLALLLVSCDLQERPLTQGQAVAEGARPNLLFIITDDQRFDMLGALHPFLETPNMDRLAAEGLRCRLTWSLRPTNLMQHPAPNLHLLQKLSKN